MVFNRFSPALFTYETPDVLRVEVLPPRVGNGLWRRSLLQVMVSFQYKITYVAWIVDTSALDQVVSSTHCPVNPSHSRCVWMLVAPLTVFDGVNRWLYGNDIETMEVGAFRGTFTCNFVSERVGMHLCSTQS